MAPQTEIARRRGPRPSQLLLRERLRTQELEVGDDPEDVEETDDGPHEDELPELRPDDDHGVDEMDGEPEARPWRRLGMPRLSIRRVGAEFRWNVRVPSLGGDALSLEQELVESERLEGLARMLVNDYRPALQASTTGEALLCLTGLAGTAIDAQLAVGSGDASRQRHLPIRLPCGVVTIGFLSWVGPSGPKAFAPQAALEIARHIAAQQLSVSGQATASAAVPTRTIADLHGLSEDTVRKYVAPLTAALAHPDLVRRWQSHFPIDVSDDLAAELCRLGGGRRNKRIARMLLAGCLDAELAAVERQRIGEETAT